MRDHVLYRPVVKISSVLLFEYLIEYASSRQIPVLLIRSIRAAQWPVTPWYMSHCKLVTYSLRMFTLLVCFYILVYVISVR